MRDRNPMRLVLMTTALAAVLLGAGCGGRSDDPDLVLAEVGDRNVTAQYYKDRLARLAPDRMPRGEDGEVLDMSSLEGKRAFLDVIIDKELMVSKAMQLGYLEDQDIAGARQMMLEAQGIKAFWEDKLGDGQDLVTQADIDHYYSRLGESRACQYLIAETLDQAQAARKAILEGMPWSEAVARYHQSTVGPTQSLRVNLQWGHYRETFQRPIFTVEKGEITEPIETEYGWWIVRVDEINHEERPPLDEILDQVRASIAKREQQIMREEIANSIKERYGFSLDEEALRIVMDGLPADETLMDPETGQPTAREKLKPLTLDPRHADKVLFSFDLASGEQVVSLGDYKANFDRKSVFERPKQSEGLSMLRRKLIDETMRVLVKEEVSRLGYLEDDRVQDAVFAMLEEMLVDRVNKELVSFDEEVPVEEIESFYAEHRSSLVRPELREGQQIVLSSEEEARQAREDWQQGRLDNLGEPTAIGPMSASTSRPISVALFDLSVGGVSEPVEMRDGWYVIRLDRIQPSEPMELDEVRSYIIQKIQSDRQEAALRLLLDRWRTEFGVKVHEDRLQTMPSWAELTGAGTSTATS